METLADEQLDAAFAALADPTRRAIVGRLAQGDATVSELAAPFAMSLPGVSKHLKVLERSGLISRRPRRPVPAVPPRGRGVGPDARLDHHPPSDLGRALRQARRTPCRRPVRAARGARAPSDERPRTRASLHPGLRGAPPARLRVHDRPGPSHPLLGAGRHERAARAHQGRRPAGRRVLHRHGQRPRRQPLPDPGRLRRGATTGASVVDRVALGHEGDDANSWPWARTAPRCGSTSATSPRPIWRRKRRPGS